MMSDVICRDEEIIRLIKSSDRKSDKLAIECLLKSYGAITRGYLRKIGVPKGQSIEDILNEAIAVFFYVVRNDRYQYKGAKIGSYVIAVGRNLWYRKLRNQKKERSKINWQDTDGLNKVEKFVLDKMAESDKYHFQQQLASDTHLQEEVEAMKSIIIHRAQFVEYKDGQQSFQYESVWEPEEESEMIESINQLSPICRNLLKDYYYKEVSLKIFAERENIELTRSLQTIKEINGENKLKAEICSTLETVISSLKGEFRKEQKLELREVCVELEELCKNTHEEEKLKVKMMQLGDILEQISNKRYNAIKKRHERCLGELRALFIKS